MFDGMIFMVLKGLTVYLIDIWSIKVLKGLDSYLSSVQSVKSQDLSGLI